MLNMNSVPKITYEELQTLLLDVEKSDEQIAPYLRLDPNRSGPFNPVLVPNPETVIMTTPQMEAESAMQIGNGLARFRRSLRFKQRRSLGSTRPVLVAEGDSWFQFPLLISDVIDHLWSHYDIWCVSAAGDTARNMVFGPDGKSQGEYLSALREQKAHVRAFLFSGAGNDIIGADENNRPVLASMIRKHIPGAGAAEHVDIVKLQEKLNFLESAYERLISVVHAEAGMESLPILIHGYDHAIPWSPGDPRKPSYAKVDEWLGQPLSANGIHDPNLRREIIVYLINQLYDMLQRVAQRHSHVYVIDVRGVLPVVEDWNDEIHGTSDGFHRVGQIFHRVLQNVI